MYSIHFIRDAIVVIQILFQSRRFVNIILQWVTARTHLDWRRAFQTSLRMHGWVRRTRVVKGIPNETQQL